MKKTKPIPHHIVTEFLGGVELVGSKERQVYVSEQLASQSYNDIQQLIDTVKGYVKSTHRYLLHVEDLKTNPFYQKYFQKEATNN